MLLFFLTVTYQLTCERSSQRSLLLKTQDSWAVTAVSAVINQQQR